MARLRGVHFLFDDTPLADQPKRVIREFLWDEEEVDAVVRVVELLDQALDEQGEADPGEVCLESRVWRHVVDAAEAALVLMGRKDAERGKEPEL